MNSCWSDNILDLVGEITLTLGLISLLSLFTFKIVTSGNLKTYTCLAFIIQDISFGWFWNKSQSEGDWEHRNFWQYQRGFSEKRDPTLAFSIQCLV